MANIYFPQSSSMLQRTTSGSAYTEIVLNIAPNAVFIFDSSSGVISSSLSVLTFTSSNAVSASYAPYGRAMVLCSGFTPTATGADVAEVTTPYSPFDGSSSLAWNIKRLSVRAQTVEGSVSSSIVIEKSTSTASFSAATIGTIVLPSGAYEASTTGSLGTITSGDKLRFNVTALGTSQYWTIITELSNT